MDAYHAHDRRRRTRRLLTACAVVVALITAVALLETRHRPAASASPPSPTPAAASHGSARGTPAGLPLIDPGKITVAQLFPGGRLTADGMTFTMVASQVVTPCALAAHGAFAAALTSAGCERVVRATFIDSGRRYAVTSGVAVLPSPASALRVDIRKRFGPDIWFTGLNAAATTGAARLTRSGGFGYDMVNGRYILFGFVTYSNGRSPTSAGANVPLLASLGKAFTDLAQQSIAARAKP